MILPIRHSGKTVGRDGVGYVAPTRWSLRGRAAVVMDGICCANPFII
jgi:hypothetical protein